LPALVSINGDRDFDSEELLAYELGYRLQMTENLSIDIAAFYNEYDTLSATESGTPSLEISSTPPYVAVPVFSTNNNYGETYGVEVVADWRALDWWRLQAAYTCLQMQIRSKEDSVDFLAEAEEARESSPGHQFSLRSLVDGPGDLELDAWLRYVDKLPYQIVESYVTLDVRLGWKLRDNLEVSIVGQNLLDDHHPEFVPEFLNVSFTEVERSVYGKVTWHF
jgi:iron complex outermembrane receptor protein